MTLSKGENDLQPRDQTVTLNQLVGNIPPSLPREMHLRSKQNLLSIHHGCRCFEKKVCVSLFHCVSLLPESVQPKNQTPKIRLQITPKALRSRLFSLEFFERMGYRNALPQRRASEKLWGWHCVVTLARRGM